MPEDGRKTGGVPNGEHLACRVEEEEEGEEEEGGERLWKHIVRKPRIIIIKNELIFRNDILLLVLQSSTSTPRRFSDQIPGPSYRFVPLLLPVSHSVTQSLTHSVSHTGESARKAVGPS